MKFDYEASPEKLYEDIQAVRTELGLKPQSVPTVAATADIMDEKAIWLLEVPSIKMAFPVSLDIKELLMMRHCAEHCAEAILEERVKKVVDEMVGPLADLESVNEPAVMNFMRMVMAKAVQPLDHTEMN